MEVSWLRKYVWHVLYAIVTLFVAVCPVEPRVSISNGRLGCGGGKEDGWGDVRRTRWR